MMLHFDASHSSDIINYYYTNYSSCPKNPSFFATWQFLSLSTHGILIIQLPLVAFTAYCIILKTPKAMGSLRWAMLNVHVWSTILDVLMCSLVTPYIFFPTLSGITLGLLSAIGVPTSVQCYISLVSMGFMFNSIGALFENRSSSFEMNRFRFERNSTRFLFFLSSGTVSAVFLLPLFLNLPNQDYAKLWVLKKYYPCPTEEFFEFPVFVLLIDRFWGYYMAIVLIAQFLWVWSAILFFIGCVTYHMYFLDVSNYSSQTKRYQRTFFIGNLLQIAIPSIFWAAPGFLIIFMYFFPIYNQSFNNCGVSFVTIHGLATMVVTLLIHHPYRIFIWKLMGVDVGRVGGKKKLEKKSSLNPVVI